MHSSSHTAAFCFVALATAFSLPEEPPAGIVDVRTVVPDIVLDVRYATQHNFVGRLIKGYEAKKCLLTKKAAEALKRVQDELREKGFSLKAYDCYRPQSAVNDFVAWGRDLSDTRMKGEFYPNVAKRNLFRDSYIATKSSHSRASTIDLTIVPLPVPLQPEFNPSVPLRSCENARANRFPDNSIDMGTGYDCFSVRSHTAYPHITAAQKQNRRLLRSLMRRHGFLSLRTEWWHYTLANEPYPRTYFDFPVQ